MKGGIVFRSSLESNEILFFRFIFFTILKQSELCFPMKTAHEEAPNGIFSRLCNVYYGMIEM